MTDQAQVNIPEWLYLDEVADQLRRSVDAVRWLINSKQLKAGKLGGRVVVRRSDLASFVASAFDDAVEVKA